MTDTLSILTARGTLRLAKQWLPDGTVRDYDDAKNYTLTRRPVTGLAELSALLTRLATRPQSCLIRGGYIGDDLARPLMAADEHWAPGSVLRKLTVFKDRALHTLMIDVDRFTPTVPYTVDDPVPAMEEFIRSHLPPCFHGVSFHWQLSNSAGLAKNAAVLKAHLWFWLATPYTGAELTAWVRAHKLNQVDVSVFRAVQPLFTANPVMAEGVTDPVAVRHGLHEGLFGDTIDLVISREVLSAVVEEASAEVKAELENAVAGDPVARVLYERGLVRTMAPRGGLYLQPCPRESEHADGVTGPTTCIYYPAHTNGYKLGNFRCHHADCVGKPQHLFTRALGVERTGETDAYGFDDEPVGESDTLTVVKDDGSCDLFASSESSVDDLFGLGSSVHSSPAHVSRLEGVGADCVSLFDAMEDSRAANSEGVSRKRIADVPEARHLCTDQANVQRLLKAFGRRLLVASDRWYAWDGVRWVPDDAIPTRYAMRLSKMISEEAAEWAAKTSDSGEEKEKNEAVAKALKGWSAKCEMRSAIDAALALLKRVLHVEADQLDKDPWLLTCANGTVDLRTGALKKHDPKDYITRLAPVPYEPAAPCPVFESVLGKVYREETAPRPVVNFMQRWFGYCATASTREQKFIVHYGQGANGKSTILDIVGEVLGDYSGTTAPGLMMSSNKDRHPTEIADLFGRRMMTAHESSEGAVLREDFIKQATGSDKIKARFMRADFFEFSPTHKLQLLTNHKPVIKSQDYGIWRRVLMVPYQARFGAPEDVAMGTATHVRDTKVAENLRAESKGVLRWVVQGAVAWFREGLNPPDYVMAASGEYQREQDRTLQFVNETCELGRDFSCFLTTDSNEGIFQVYESWCKEGGFFSLSKTRFLQELERVVPNFAAAPERVRTFDGRRKKVLSITGVRLMQD